MLRRPRNVTLGREVRIARDVVFDVADGAHVRIGDGAELGPRCRFHVAAGEVTIGAGAHLGEGCVLAAHERIEVGPHALLDDGVVLVDFDHVFADVEKPIREQGVATAPIRLGERVIVDRGASILRGVTVGAGARVTTHAVVTRDVAPGATVAGVPAKA